MNRKTISVQLSETEIADVLARAERRLGKKVKLGTAIRRLLGFEEIKIGAPRGNQNAVGNAGRWKQSESDDESEEE